MADVKKLAEELVNLTVKEVNELATILKEEYGIEPAAAAVAVAAAPAAAGEAAAEKSTFDVILKSAGQAKLQVIKVVKDVAGLSLGEFSALACAGVFDARTAVALTAFRGKAMAAAAAGRSCGMTAVLNLDRVPLAECCEQASALGCVQICNYNCPGQLVIGGEKAAVDKAAELAKQAGARRCIPLKVSGPFHTRLMAPAGDALAKRFTAEPFGEMQAPVRSNCLGREKAESDSIPALLVRQVQSSVYMEDTLHRLGELGVDHILEVGPGNALSGFVKKTLPGVTCVSVETPAQLDTVLNAWKEEQ